jgi:hypothetical protein
MMLTHWLFYGVAVNPYCAALGTGDLLFGVKKRFVYHSRSDRRRWHGNCELAAKIRMLGGNHGQRNVFF